MSSKRLFAGLLYAGRLFLPSLFRGVGSVPQTPGIADGIWTVVPGLRVWAARPGLRTWKIRTSHMADLVSDPISKTAGDRLWLEADFGDLPELLATPPDTITGQTFTQVSLIITGTALVGTYKVGAWFSGGAAGTTYNVAVSITLASGATVSRTLPLVVE